MSMMTGLPEFPNPLDRVFPSILPGFEEDLVSCRKCRPVDFYQCFPGDEGDNPLLSSLPPAAST